MTLPPKRLSEILFSPGFIVLIDGGTTPCATSNAFAAVAQHYGLDLQNGQHVRIIQFDAQRDAVAARVPFLDDVRSLADVTWTTSIEGQVPDGDSLQALERRGDFYYTKPNWAATDGQMKEAAGTGGRARRGRALFRCARHRFRRALTLVMRDFCDYKRQEAGLMDSGREPDGAVLPIIITYDTPGGVGPGILEDLKREIADVANGLGVSIRLFTIGMALGSIAPANPVQGALNEEALLRYQQASLATNIDYTGTVEGPSRHIPQSNILVTNQNPYGEIPSLSHLEGFVGQVKLHLAATPVGRLLMERVIDVEGDGQVDEHGGPCISTMGKADLHFHAEKLLGHAAYETLRQLSEAMLAEVDPLSIRQKVTATARHLGLVESLDEPLASTRVARLEPYGGADVFERLRSVFEAHTKELKGFRRLQALPQAYRNTLTVELAKNLSSALREGCRRLFSDSVAVIRQEMDACMVRMDGVRRSQRYLADLQTILAQSARTNAEVSRAVAERARPNQRLLSDIEEQTEHLAQQNAVVRAFQFLTVRRLTRTYLLAAEADLRCQAELDVRTALDQHLYRPLLAAIGQEVARVDGHVARLEALRDRAATGAKDMANLPSDYLVSVGIEFATAEFCVRKTRLLIADLGGTEGATRRVFQTFLEQVKSLDVLRDRDLDAVERTLVPICQKLFEDTIKAMDLLTLFAEEFPEPGRQREVVEQLVREASGRLVVTGEAGRQIPWIKIAGFGTAAGAEGFLRLLRDTDREIGEWLPCDHGDRYTVTLMMFRSQVSLEGHLRHLRRRLLEGAPAMTVDSGADPIIWLLPSADPSPEELAATIVRGLAAGGISQSGTLFSYIDPETGESSLGGNAAEVHRALAESYAARLHLTLDFVRALATRHDETLARLKALRAVLGNSGSVLAELLSEEAIQAVEQNAQDLWPYLKRLPGREV